MLIVILVSNLSIVVMPSVVMLNVMASIEQMQFLMGAPTNFGWKNQTLGKFSTLEVAAYVPNISFAFIAKRPILELKTR
jgi:hypothetical protein